MKVGYIGGTFDLLHSSHIKLFERAKGLVDYLVVAINTDEFCKQYKREPIIHETQRANLVSVCRHVDDVVWNIGGKDSKKTINKWNELYPNKKITHVFHGDDWIGDSLKKQMGFTDKWLEDNGITMVYLDNTKGISTTDIIERIKTRSFNNNRIKKSK